MVQLGVRERSRASTAEATGPRSGDGQPTWDVHGPAGAPALILLHGTRVTRTMWEPQVQALATRFRIVAPDLPGHGVLAGVRFKLRDAAALTMRAIDAETTGRAIVVGQSLGGYIAMDLAARHPERVAGLVLCNCSVEPRTVARTAPRTIGAYLVGAASERIRGRGTGERLMEPLVGAEIIEELGHRVGPGGTTLDPDAPADPPATQGWLFKGGGRALVTALRTAFVPRLRDYPGPTMILNGADDRVFRRSELEFLAACVNGQLEVIGGAGHLVNSEQPERFNDLLTGFAGRVYGIDPD